MEALLRATTATVKPLKPLEGPIQRFRARLCTMLHGKTEIDIVVSGGALRGYFLLGARHAIEDRGDLEVRRYSGTSAGAWAAMLMATGVSSGDWLRTYTLTQAASREAKAKGESPPALMEAYNEVVWPFLKTVLPPDAYKRCSGRLHVTITTLEKMRPTKLTVSQFASNEEIFEACVASSSVPLVTQKGFGQNYQNKRAFDGLFTENVPLFADKKRPQLVFDLGKVQYSLQGIIQPNDPCIEALAVNGALQTSRFLSGRRGDPNLEVLSWRGKPWGEPGREYPNHRRGPFVQLPRLPELPRLQLPKMPSMPPPPDWLPKDLDELLRGRLA